MKKQSILILYDPHSLFTDSVRQHLLTIGKSDEFLTFYAAATDQAICYFNPDDFDIVVVHYCVRVALGWHLSEDIATKLKGYSGKLVLFLQDEYDYTEKTRQFIEQYKISLVFTCVPEDAHHKIYPPNRFPNTQFINTLTGYTLPFDEDHRPRWSLLKDRSTLVGYRGRKLPPVYGELGREKYLIGHGVKEYCSDKNLVCDIEWDESKRIYGDDWHKFLKSSRASLGTESGSNVFDENGEIRSEIEAYQKRNPEAKYDEIYNSCVRAHDDFIKMNQISPRLFESIMAGTVLILFEGKYSGILKPETHYFSLQKDFSNAAEILSELDNFEKLEAMRQSAYEDVIASEIVSFGHFRDEFERHMLKLMGRSKTSITPFKLTVDQLIELKPRPSQDTIHAYLTSIPIDARLNLSSNDAKKVQLHSQDGKDGLPFPNQPMLIRKLARLVPWEFRQKVKSSLRKFEN